MLTLHLRRSWRRWYSVFGMTLGTIDGIIWWRVCQSEFKQWSKQEGVPLIFSIRLDTIYTTLYPPKISRPATLWWWSNSRSCGRPSGLISGVGQYFPPIIVDKVLFVWTRSLWNCHRVEIMDDLNAILEGKIVWALHTRLSLTVQDFKGQQLADTITEVLLCVFALLAFLVGYLWQNIVYTASIMGAGILLVCLVGKLSSPLR